MSLDAAELGFQGLSSACLPWLLLATPVGLAAQSSPEGVPLDGVSLGLAGLCPDNEIPANLRS